MTNSISTKLKQIKQNACTTRKRQILSLFVLVTFGLATVMAENVTITLDSASNSVFVIQDAQSNILTTVWSDGRVVSGGGGYDSVTSNSVVNTATGPFSTVSGGLGNLAGSNAWYGSTGGGYMNGTYGLGSTVAGGVYNSAQGSYGMVPGGIDNHASGNYSFAAGRGAIANHPGAFVWGDSTAAYIYSDATNQFKIRASGGTKIFTDSNSTVGLELAPGGNSWLTVSDRNLKENFKTVDINTLLNEIDSMPITTWNMKTQDKSIRHIGPVAQDFYSAFGFGENNTHISSSDADGVSLAAVQGLYRLIKKLDNENRELHASIKTLDQRLSALESNINRDTTGEIK